MNSVAEYIKKIQHQLGIGYIDLLSELLLLRTGVNSINLQDIRDKEL